MDKILKNWIFDFIAAAVCTALGILMLPVFELRQSMMEIIFALLLISYVAIFVIRAMRRTTGGTFMVLAFEAVAVTLVAATLILQQFGISLFAVSGVTRTVGILLWIHGASRLMYGYVRAFAGVKHKYSLPLFLAYILLASLGVYMFAAPFISDGTLSLVLCVVLFLLAATFAVLGFAFIPRRSGK